MRGFTLIELLAVVAITAILAAIAAPPMSQFITRNRIASQANDLLSLLASARMQAIRERTPVGVCATNDPKGSADCVSDGDWGAGIAVYAFNALGNRAADAAGTPLPPVRILQAANNGNVVTRNGASGPIRFGQSGRWLDFAGNGNIAFILSSDNSDEPAERRAVCLYPSGNSRVVATRSNGRGTGASC